MSRSYKKTPLFKSHLRNAKRQANRLVRRRLNRGALDLVLSGKGNFYRRVVDTWTIAEPYGYGDLQDALTPSISAVVFRPTYRLVAGAFVQVGCAPTTISRPLGTKYFDLPPRDAGPRYWPFRRAWLSK